MHRWELAHLSWAGGRQAGSPAPGAGVGVSDGGGGGREWGHTGPWLKLWNAQTQIQTLYPSSGTSLSFLICKAVIVIRLTSWGFCQLSELV